MPHRALPRPACSRRRPPGPAPGRPGARLHLLLLALILAFAPHRAHAAVACGSPNAIGAAICHVDPAIDPAALCNDGTQPVFWIRPGHDTGAATWVIWLEGGGNCIDAPSCTSRAASPTGAKDLTSNGFTMAVGHGLLSPDPRINPLLYNANIVMAHYCSSDDWSGAYASPTAFSPTDPTTWHFQGRRIAAAVVASVTELDAGLGAAHTLLLGGSSAGGLGMTYNVNDLLPALPAAPDIRFINDAGFALDIGQYDPSQPAPYIYPSRPDAFDINFLAGMALWHGHGDTGCDAAATTPQAHVDCFNSALLLQQGVIGLPAFVAESQLDLAQVADQLCPSLYGLCRLPINPATKQGQYVTAFGTAMQAALVGAGTPAAYSVASPDVYAHVILADDTVSTASLLPGGTSPAAALDAWLGGTGSPRVLQFGTTPGVSPIKLQ